MSSHGLIVKMEGFFKHVDSKAELWIEKLREAVAIDSVSAEPARRPRCVDMMEWTKLEMEKLGITCALHDIGMQNHPSGTEVPLPPILTGVLGSDSSKRTICIYGHLDVQPAALEDGWNTDPWVLTEVDEKLYGRGSTDDKGPVLAWLWAIQSYQELNIEIPVNLKFVLEGMEESGSVGLDEWIFANAPFFEDVDYTCISDNYWLGSTKPCITFGLRGLCAFEITVKCAQKDLHSGVFGGPVHDAMPDLVRLMNTLNTDDNKIAIKDLAKEVLPLSAEETRNLNKCDFDIEAYKSDIGASALKFTSKKDVLASRWREPSLTLHGIEGAWSGQGSKTVIPCKVIGKFSIRTVPTMTVDHVKKSVDEHFAKAIAALNSPNFIEVKCTQSADPWLADHNDDNYKAARLAIREVFQVDPDLTREGGSIPVTNSFTKVTGKSVMLLPIGAGDDSAHSQNEKINRRNYIDGIKLLGAYLNNLPAVGQTLGDIAPLNPEEEVEEVPEPVFSRHFKACC